MNEIQTTEELRNYADRAGSFFFRPDTMRYWRSRVMDGIYGGAYFVTSEQMPGYERRYTVRRFTLNDDETISFDTVGEFQEFSTRAQAVSAAKSAATMAVI